MSKSSQHGTVYLICFSEPIGSERHHAQHYIGWAQNVEWRLKVHLSGQGARILAYVRQQGLTVKLVRTWPGSRSLERRLKQRGHGPQLCPWCSGSAAYRRAAR